MKKSRNLVLKHPINNSLFTFHTLISSNLTNYSNSNYNTARTYYKNNSKFSDILLMNETKSNNNFNNNNFNNSNYNNNFNTIDDDKFYVLKNIEKKNLQKFLITSIPIRENHNYIKVYSEDPKNREKFKLNRVLDKNQLKKLHLLTKKEKNENEEENNKNKLNNYNKQKILDVSKKNKYIQRRIDKLDFLNSNKTKLFIYSGLKHFRNVDFFGIHDLKTIKVSFINKNKMKNNKTLNKKYYKKKSHNPFLNNSFDNNNNDSININQSFDSTDENNNNNRNSINSKKSLKSFYARFKKKTVRRKSSYIMPIKKLDDNYGKFTNENQFSVINEVNFKKLKKIQELKEQLKIKNQKEKIDKLITNEFKPINNAIEYKIEDNKNKLDIQINNRFKLDFQIVNPKNFPDKYNFENLMIPKKGIDYSQLIQEKLKNYNLKKEVVKKINKIMVKEKHKKNQNLLNKFKKTIIKCAIHFKKLNISLSEFYSLNYKNIKPFEHNETKLLLTAIKDGNFSLVYDLIMKNNLLIYDFDYFHQTVLHWMAKRNKYNMIKFAIKNGAIINAIDSVGRTPLHLACYFQNIESVMILLYEFASPFIKDNQGKMAIDLAKDYNIVFMLKRVNTLYLINGVLSVKKFEENFRNGLNFLFNKELNLKFNYDDY